MRDMSGTGVGTAGKSTRGDGLTERRLTSDSTLAELRRYLNSLNMDVKRL